MENKMNEYPEQRAYYLYFAKTQINDQKLKRLLIVLADHIGKDNPIRLEDLVELVYEDQKYEKQCRDGLKALRDEYDIPIGSNSGMAGRWIIIDREDQYHTANELDSRAYEMLATSRKLRQMNLRPSLTPQAMAEVQTNQGRLWG